MVGQIISVWLPMSPWGSDWIFPNQWLAQAWRTVSEDPPRTRFDSLGFLLIVPTRHIVTVDPTSRCPKATREDRLVVRDTGMFQHTARFYNGPLW